MRGPDIAMYSIIVASTLLFTNRFDFHDDEDVSFFDGLVWFAVVIQGRRNSKQQQPQFMLKSDSIRWYQRLPYVETLPYASEILTKS